MKLAPLDMFFFEYACQSASELKDDVTLLKLLNHGWQKNLINRPGNALILAELIFQHQSKDVELLQEVLTAILHNHERSCDRKRQRRPQPSVLSYSDQL